jgi:hypothetical protein
VSLFLKIRGPHKNSKPTSSHYLAYIYMSYHHEPNSFSETVTLKIPSLQIYLVSQWFKKDRSSSRHSSLFALKLFNSLLNVWGCNKFCICLALKTCLYLFWFKNRMGLGLIYPFQILFLYSRLKNWIQYLYVTLLVFVWGQKVLDLGHDS